jgi:hypothetical protein
VQLIPFSGIQYNISTEYNLIIFSMPEFDYYSVMQKRIEYLAQKYDPYNRFSTTEVSKPAEKEDTGRQKKAGRLRKSVSAGYSALISFLF